jgi:hypothetical protein
VQFFAAISNNGGAGFLPNVELSNGQTDATDPALSGVAQANQLGDYTTTTFANGVFYPIWTDNSPLLGGNPNLPEFDMATQRVVVVQVADAPLAATKGADVSVVAGSALTNITVATFTDGNPAPDPNDFSATINWGDNTTPTPGAIAGSFTVTGTHTYASAGTYSIVVTIKDAGGRQTTTGETATVRPLALGPPDAPQLDAADDTGVSNSDGITNHDGSAGAPLNITVMGVDPPNAEVWIYDTDLNPPVRISASPFTAANGTVHFFLNAPVPDGTYHFTATTTLSVSGPESDMSPVATLVIDTSLKITSTSPAGGATVAALPDGNFTLNFSHALAGLSDGGPALGAGDPTALALAPSGGGAAVSITTQYHVNADGTSSISVHPVSVLAQGSYVVQVVGGAFHDLAGNALTVASGGFTFSINPALVPPTINPIADQSGTPGSTLRVQVSVTDPVAGRALVYSLVGSPPAGAAIDPNTGLFTWMPTAGQAGFSGTITVKVAVAASPDLSVTRGFNVSISNPQGSDEPPTINPIADQTVAPGSTLSVQISVTDPVGGRALVYSLPGSPPAGTAIDPSSGLFTWTPTADQAGFSGIILVKVALAANPGTSFTRSFNVSVASLVPPRITGQTLGQLHKGRKNLGTFAIHLFFNEAMNSSAGAAAQYVLTTPKKGGGRKKGPASAPVGFASTYDPGTSSVTLLFKPTKSPLTLTVRKSVTAANGVSLGSDTTLRIQ